MFSFLGIVISALWWSLMIPLTALTALTILGAAWCLGALIVWRRDR